MPHERATPASPLVSKPAPYRGPRASAGVATVVFAATSLTLVVVTSAVSVYWLEWFDPTYGQGISFQITAFAMLVPALLNTLGFAIGVLSPSVPARHKARMYLSSSVWSFVLWVCVVAVAISQIHPVVFLASPFVAGLATRTALESAVQGSFLGPISSDACINCGYSLRSGAGRPCPECGHSSLPSGAHENTDRPGT